MDRLDPDTCRRRTEMWRRLEVWSVPVSPRERETRLRWLQEVVSMAEERGAPPKDPWDSSEIRARRQALREALARIRD